MQTWQLAQDFVTKAVNLQWYNKERILVHNEQTVRVFDLYDPSWKASIEGAARNLGQVQSVTFGRTADEILIASDFGVKLTIWSLITRRGAEIKDPKMVPGAFAPRPKTGHLAILTRPAAQDSLLLVAPGSHDIVKNIDLGTVDAQEVQWSKDGAWLAVRDVPSAGHRVQVYTADGHLFRTFTGVEDSENIDLGVRCMTWSPAGLLILGDHNGRIMLLSKMTVGAPSPFFTMTTDAIR